MMREIHTPAPNPFRSRGPYRGMGSKDWVPINPIQRVGAFIIGAIFVIGGAACIVSTVASKAELAAVFHPKWTAVSFSFFLVCCVLTGGGVVIWLGIRLLKGAVRSDPKRL